MFSKGVVEDRNDPEELGRCKVRWLGVHTEDKVLLKTEDLPWSYPIQPIHSAAMSGVGETPIGPVEGTWVVGVFVDLKEASIPMFFGTLGGIPQNAADPETGFNDPNAKYPLEDLLNEPDTNRLARGVEEDTVVQSKKENLDEMSYPVGGGQREDKQEPETPFAAEYPFNHVKFTESGHVQEFDDTEGAERIHTYHRSGSFEEIHPDGSKVTKIVKDTYTAVLGEENIHIALDSNNHIAGNLNLLVEGNTNIKIIGDVDARVDGKLDLSVLNNINMTSETGNVNIKTPSGNINLN